MKVELVKGARKNKLDCLNCGVCCYFPELRGKNPINSIIVGEDGWCIYYDKEEKCTIYDKRPICCRQYISGGSDCIKKRERYLHKIEKE